MKIKSAKLRKNREFQRVYKFGKSFANKILVVYVFYHPQNSERRVGFTVSKKFGNAVKRNRLKRLMKEAYRLNQYQIQDGIDLIFLPRQRIIGAKFKEIEKGMTKLFSKAGILKKDK
ncbi:MAG: ribonuclease P protein component [Halanaerobiales bacterium]|nr:ribonuclease P protein component [Halanaerobiales bacterium]